MVAATMTIMMPAAAHGTSQGAYGPDGTFRGQNRQVARTAQLSLQFEF